MARPRGWALAWVLWLAAFLLVEVPAASLKRGGTLSAHVRKWFRGPARRSVLGAFMVALTAHFVFDASAWWLLTAVPVAAVIVDGVWWAGDMSLIDKAVRALALRWSKGKIDGARRGGSAVLKLLDGNKRLIVTLGFVVSGLVALFTGQEVSQWLDLILRAFGWTDASVIAGAKELATQIVPLLFALWAAASGLWKMWKQYKAGATATELSSPIGVVKAALADGTLSVASAEPVTLVMTASPPLAADAGAVALVVKRAEA